MEKVAGLSKGTSKNLPDAHISVRRIGFLLAPLRKSVTFKGRGWDKCSFLSRLSCPQSKPA